jgi:hypothetical protein
VIDEATALAIWVCSIPLEREIFGGHLAFGGTLNPLKAQ